MGGRQLPLGVTRHHLPRADALWMALKNARVVVASGEGYSSAHVVDRANDLHDQAIGRPTDKLWGTRIEPSGVDANVFVALASNSAGRRSVAGRRLSLLARRFLAAGPNRVFIGVEGEIPARRASVIADELLERMMTMPFQPLSVIVRALELDFGDKAYQLVVIGEANYSFARALTPADPFLLSPPVPEPVVVGVPEESVTRSPLEAEAVVLGVPEEVLPLPPGSMTPVEMPGDPVGVAEVVSEGPRGASSPVRVPSSPVLGRPASSPALARPPSSPSSRAPESFDGRVEPSHRSTESSYRTRAPSRSPVSSRPAEPSRSPAPLSSRPPEPARSPVPMSTRPTAADRPTVPASSRSPDASRAPLPLRSPVPASSPVPVWSSGPDRMPSMPPLSATLPARSPVPASSPVPEWMPEPARVSGLTRTHVTDAPRAPSTRFPSSVMSKTPIAAITPVRMRVKATPPPLPSRSPEPSETPLQMMPPPLPTRSPVPRGSSRPQPAHLPPLPMAPVAVRAEPPPLFAEPAMIAGSVGAEPILLDQLVV